jgi:hypothetical protein
MAGARLLLGLSILTAFASCSSIVSASAKAIGPAIMRGSYRLTASKAEEVLSDIQRRCRCTACGSRRADLRPDYSKHQAASQSVGWMMPPG